MLSKYFFEHNLRARTTSPSSRTLGRRARIEKLEPRCFLSANDVWSSLVFDNGAAGSLEWEFERNIATVDPQGVAVAANQPRFGTEQALVDISSWTAVKSLTSQEAIIGSGWDHDGQTPLAVSWDQRDGRLKFYRGYDYTEVASMRLVSQMSGDLMDGSVTGFTYYPRSAIVYDGLVVFEAERSRLEDGALVPEGVSFIYTQDYGTTMERVAQVGGGFDVPAFAGGASDGGRRGNAWSFANAFPETDSGDRLGAWFPWADYQHQSGNPQGGQIGLFRARRDSVEDPWVVEPNLLVYESWQPEDAGGYHAHTAGMFSDGLVSFWGDVDYRNGMVRHIADDLENYTTTTWTHNEDFQGGWSPDDDKVYEIGNQGVSAAPGPIFGEVLVAGDEQPEVVMKVQRPETLDGNAIISNLHGSYPGPPSGGGLSGRLSLWLQHQPGVGYILRDTNSRIDNADAFYFSADGEHWAGVQNLGTGFPKLYGNQLLVTSNDLLYTMDLPDAWQVQSPLVINPGGANLVEQEWNEVVGPSEGNELRRVEYVAGQYVYADSGLPLPAQPDTPPPVADGMPLWEVTSEGLGSILGRYEITSTPTSGDQVHWLSAWHYLLNGDGASPQFRLGSNSATEKYATWVTNNQWVPTLTAGMPEPADPSDKVRPLKMATGNHPPSQWLMAIEGYQAGEAPSYPLPPDTVGPDELVSIETEITTQDWTVGFTFGLSEIASFSSFYDPLGTNTSHSIATLWESDTDYIEVNFARTSTTDGTLSLDIYDDSVMVNQVEFTSWQFDREDEARLLISSTDGRFGATLLSTRHAYGVQDQSVAFAGMPIIPSEILLSDVTRTRVSPTEWFSVQVNNSQGLNTSSRVAFIQSDKMLLNLDDPSNVILSADFDQDGLVDGVDFLTWQRSIRAPVEVQFADGDSDADGDADEVDLNNWQVDFGQSGSLSTDFDQSGQADGIDFLTWQRSVQFTGILELEDGDSDADCDVDLDDLANWNAEYGPVDPPAAALDSATSQSEGAPEAKSPAPLGSGLAGAVADPFLDVEEDALIVMAEVSAETPRERVFADLPLATPTLTDDFGEIAVERVNLQALPTELDSLKTSVWH